METYFGQIIRKNASAYTWDKVQRLFGSRKVFALKKNRSCHIRAVLRTIAVKAQIELLSHQ